MMNMSTPPASRCDNTTFENNLALQQLIGQLDKQPFAILDELLPANDYKALLNLAQEWDEAGKFRTAMVGKSTQATRIEEIRRDKICWLDEDNKNPAISTYYRAINALIKTLNRSYFLGLTDFEMHFAIYQPGDFYRKHIDQFKNTSNRRISCVYYLNTHWEAADAGELQLYDQQNHPVATIAPLGNRLVCFHSDLPHEVYPTQQTRYSLTGWLKTSA